LLQGIQKILNGRRACARHSRITSESWKNLNWKKFRKDLFRLQGRVFKAVRAGDKRKALSLQKLILKSVFSQIFGNSSSNFAITQVRKQQV